MKPKVKFPPDQFELCDIAHAMRDGIPRLFVEGVHYSQNSHARGGDMALRARLGNYAKKHGMKLSYRRVDGNLYAQFLLTEHTPC